MKLEYKATFADKTLPFMNTTTTLAMGRKDIEGSFWKAYDALERDNLVFVSAEFVCDDDALSTEDVEEFLSWKDWTVDDYIKEIEKQKH